MDAKELTRMLWLKSVPESYIPTEEVGEARVLMRGRQTLVENLIKYTNKAHGLLSDHGIIGDVKPLKMKGWESLRKLSFPVPWDTLLESYPNLIESLTEEIQKLDKTTEERAGSLKRI